MNARVSRMYRFGDFMLDPVEQQLRCKDREIFLRPKAFETLLCLVERQGHLVRKNDLMDKVWPETAVSEAVLSHCIAEVRHALKDDPGKPSFVATVPRLGYKFLAKTEESVLESEETKQSVVEAAPESAIVVLPFKNISADPENEYFCDGLSEELINGLTKNANLRVVAHSSAFTFKGHDTDVREIGKRLNVGSVLEGSVRKAGRRLRISVQLINACNGYHIWSEQYDRKVEDVFVIQDEIAQSVLKKLKLGGTQEIRAATSNMEAYTLYLKGRSFSHRRYRGFMQKAIECFEEAIEKDPAYALAYAGLADCYVSIGVWGMADPHVFLPKAKEMAEKALKIDNGLAEAHASRGVISLAYDWDWPAAERSLKKSLALNPGYAMTHLWHSHYLAILGLLKEAVEEARQAQKLDPLSPVINTMTGYTLFLAGECESALREVRKTLDLDPYFGTAYMHLGMVLAYQGHYSDAIEAHRKCLEMTGGLLRMAAGSLGYASAMAGDFPGARAILQEYDGKQAYIPPFARAMIYIGMGDDAKAYEWLNQAYAGRDFALAWMKVLPIFNRLRDQPQFQKLLARMHLA